MRSAVLIPPKQETAQPVHLTRIGAPISVDHDNHIAAHRRETSAERGALPGPALVRHDDVGPQSPSDLLCRVRREAVNEHHLRHPFGDVLEHPRKTGLLIERRHDHAHRRLPGSALTPRRGASPAAEPTLARAAPRVRDRPGPDNSIPPTSARHDTISSVNMAQPPSRQRREWKQLGIDDPAPQAATIRPDSTESAGLRRWRTVPIESVGDPLAENEEVGPYPERGRPLCERWHLRRVCSDQRPAASGRERQPPLQKTADSLP